MAGLISIFPFSEGIHNYLTLDQAVLTNVLLSPFQRQAVQNNPQTKTNRTHFYTNQKLLFQLDI